VEALREQARAGSAGDGFEVKVEQARANQRVIYVIFFNSASLDVFQRQQLPIARSSWEPEAPAGNGAALAGASGFRPLAVRGWWT
jgi:hypothetical protein